MDRSESMRGLRIATELELSAPMAERHISFAIVHDSRMGAWSIYVTMERPPRDSQTPDYNADRVKTDRRDAAPQPAITAECQKWSTGITGRAFAAARSLQRAEMIAKLASCGAPAILRVEQRLVQRRLRILMRVDASGAGSSGPVGFGCPPAAIFRLPTGPAHSPSLQLQRSSAVL